MKKILTFPLILVATFCSPFSSWSNTTNPYIDLQKLTYNERKILENVEYYTQKNIKER